MPTATRQTATARPLTTAGYAVPAAPRPRPIPATKLKARGRVQWAWIAVMLMMAFLAVAGGVLYLSGHAKLAAEGYRRVALMRQLQQEQRKSQQLRELQGTQVTPETIDREAKKLGMVRADDRDTVTVR